MADTCNISISQKNKKSAEYKQIFINLSCNEKIQTKILICYINTLRKCHYIINILENQNCYILYVLPNPRVLKEVAEALTPPLLILLRKSLDEGSLPDDWKQGNITAIHKKGSKAYPCNYRPISLTSIICKLFEAIIRDAIVTHMSVNNLFCD